MNLKKGQEIVFKIDSLVYGGRGIGTWEGLKIFVEDVVPGDTVKAKFTKIKSNFAEAKLVEVLEKSPQRIEPRCKHFETCGGCKWQFLPYEAQLKVKEQQVRDAIEKIGHMDANLVLPAIGNESPWFYRNKMELSFDNEQRLGFYPKGFHY